MLPILYPPLYIASYCHFQFESVRVASSSPTNTHLGRPRTPIKQSNIKASTVSIVSYNNRPNQLSTLGGGLPHSKDYIIIISSLFSLSGLLLTMPWVICFSRGELEFCTWIMMDGMGSLADVWSLENKDKGGS